MFLNEVVSLFTSSDLNEILSTSCPIAYMCYSSMANTAQLCGLWSPAAIFGRPQTRSRTSSVGYCSSTFTVHCHILKICNFFGYQQYRSDQNSILWNEELSGWRSRLIQLVLVQNKVSAVLTESGEGAISLWFQCFASKFSRIIRSEIIVHVLWMGNTCCTRCFPILCKLHMTDWLR